MKLISLMLKNFKGLKTLPLSQKDYQRLYMAITLPARLQLWMPCFGCYLEKTVRMLQISESKLALTEKKCHTVNMKFAEFLN